MHTTTLDEQIDRLVQLGYSTMLGCSEQALRDSLQPLQAHVPKTAAVYDTEAGSTGCVLVLVGPSLPVDRTLPLVVRDGHQAVEKLFPRSPAFFQPAEGLHPTASGAYLLLDVERGDAMRNATPQLAAAQLREAGRSPLTIEEGIALLTQHPAFLQKNHCFMMLGSRGDDKRVPALWLSGKQPKLGWCWEGNPHTWLGFASCASRSPAVRLPG